MNNLDNEFYRVAEDVRPTLESDLQTRTAEPVVILTEPVTAELDIKATSEEPAEEASGTKKESGIQRMIKALKLLASVFVTAAVAATVTTAAEPGLRNVDLLWPQETPEGLNLVSQHSGSALFSMYDSVYELTTTRDDLFVKWEGTRVEEDGTVDDASVWFYSVDDDLDLLFGFSKEPYDYEASINYYDTLTATNGEVFYVEMICMVADSFSSDYMEYLWDTYTPYFEISRVSDPDWGQVYLCDSMYTVLNQYWSGQSQVGPDETTAFFNMIEYTRDVDGFGSFEYVGQRTMNGITWSFYYDEADYDLWAVPAQEPDICLGASAHSLLNSYNCRQGAQWDNTVNIPAQREHMDELIDFMCEVLGQYRIREDYKTDVPQNPEVSAKWLAEMGLTMEEFYAMPEDQRNTLLGEMEQAYDPEPESPAENGQAYTVQDVMAGGSFLVQIGDGRLNNYFLEYADGALIRAEISFQKSDEEEPEYYLYEGDNLEEFWYYGMTLEELVQYFEDQGYGYTVWIESLD